MRNEHLVGSQEAVDLVRIVSNRLFKAVLVLLVMVLAISLLIYRFDRLEGGVAILIILTGALGGFVSIQRRLKQLTIGDLQLFASSRIYILLSPLIGSVLALLLYLIFVSGLIRGDLFPVFRPDPSPKTSGISELFAQHAVGFSSYAKILVWSFIAGFSEHFVIDIIGRFEKAAPTQSP